MHRMRCQLCSAFLSMSRSRLMSTNSEPSVAESTAAAPPTITGWGLVDDIMKKYEDVVGLTEVKEAQENVMSAENRFTKAQMRRREAQTNLSEIVAELKQISAELDKVHRGDERYLSLLTREHEVIKAEQRAVQAVEAGEADERSSFSLLSSAVRESHEKERTRAERTKYWSVIGSVIGAVIGITGTTFNNQMRMRELRRMVHGQVDSSVKTHELIGELTETSQKHFQNLSNFLGASEARGQIASVMNLDDDQEPKAKQAPASHAAFADHLTEQILSKQNAIDEQLKLLVTCIREQDNVTQARMDQLLKSMAVRNLTETNGAGAFSTDMVLLGTDLDGKLKETEENLELKMKYYALGAVVAFYAGVVLIVPLVQLVFGR